MPGGKKTVFFSRRNNIETVMVSAPLDVLKQHLGIFLKNGPVASAQSLDTGTAFVLLLERFRSSWLLDLHDPSSFPLVRADFSVLWRLHFATLSCCFHRAGRSPSPQCLMLHRFCGSYSYLRSVLSVRCLTPPLVARPHSLPLLACRSRHPCPFRRRVPSCLASSPHPCQFCPCLWLSY